MRWGWGSHPLELVLPSWFGYGAPNAIYAVNYPLLNLSIPSNDVGNTITYLNQLFAVLFAIIILSLFAHGIGFTVLWRYCAKRWFCEITWHIYVTLQILRLDAKRLSPIPLCMIYCNLYFLSLHTMNNYGKIATNCDLWHALRSQLCRSIHILLVPPPRKQNRITNMNHGERKRQLYTQHVQLLSLFFCLSDI